MILFMGPNGAGKSVQGQLLSKNSGYKWLSTGEYLRSHLSPEREAQMKAGKLLADEELFDVMEDFFGDIKDQSKVIIDGFPRTLNQAKWLLERHLEGEFMVSSVVFLEASKELIMKRLATRGRDDDKPEIIERRYNSYLNETLPIIDWFERNRVKVLRIDADAEIDSIQQEILSKLGIKSSQTS